MKIGLTGLAGAIILERGHDYFTESKARGKIVIVGGGVAKKNVPDYGRLFKAT
jgi:hypothetical protein